MTTAPLIEVPAAVPNRQSNLSADLCAIILAITLTLVIRGYQFGRSNHTVYLLDALRVNDPNLLANDWYTTHTLQYHFVFTHLTAAFDRMGILRPAYLIGYLTIVIFFQLAWYLLNQKLGGNRRTYLFSVLLYYLSAGGAGLGVFCFMQDSAFVPSNISNIAMLWAIHFWMTRRPIRSAVLFGLAGFFHLNHALVAIALWTALVMWDQFDLLSIVHVRARSESQTTNPTLSAKSILFGAIAVLAMCLPNLIPAARASLGGPHKIPLREFVDLYVHLRHPHHYDPLSWPIALWLSFLWPFPLAILAIRRLPESHAIREACRVSLLICGMMLVAFLFAGVWFISEPLVQASLFRFSIYPKLLTCIGAAIYLYDRTKKPALTYVSFVVAAVAAIVICLWKPYPPILAANLPTVARLLLIALFFPLFELADISHHFNQARLLARVTQWFWAISMMVIVTEAWMHATLGLTPFVGADPAPDYKSVCEFARDHTPADALFLVPPDEQEFRLLARRAIVINFKGVAQLSSELGEWRARLCRVLDIPSLNVLPKHFDQVFDALANRYEQLTPDHLREVADQYHARYIITTRPFPAPAKADFESGSFHLYDLQGQGSVHSNRKELLR